MRLRRFLPVVLALLFLLPSLAWAKKHKHLHGTVVTSVDVAAQKIVLTDKDNRQAIQYQISPGAIITINDQPAKLSELHADMAVVTYTEAEEHVISQIDLQSTKVH